MIRQESRPLPRWLAVLLLGGLLLWPLAPLPAQQATINEYEVKAVFLFNFFKFVKWPSQSLPNDNLPFTIGILGEDPFSGALERTIQNETIAGRSLRIRRSPRPNDLRGCQIVFISKSERARTPEVLAALKGSGILTVGEFDRFSHLGGVINFTVRNGRVGFEINVGAMRHAGLEISSRLLKCGTIVSSG